MISFLIILAIGISIYLGDRTKINTGIFAIGFAYIIGCFVMGIAPKNIINAWPVNIFFTIFSVSLFFNFAVSNGTLEKLANYLLYYSRNFAKALPLILFFISALIAGLGAGYFTVMAFMGPIAMILCGKAKVNRMVGAMGVNWGALAGANFMVSPSGIIFRSLLSETSLAPKALEYTTTIFAVSFIMPIIIVSILILITSKKGQNAVIEIEKPEAFTKNQKINLYLIFALIALVLVFPILHAVFKNVAWITFANDKMNITLLAIIFALIAFLLQLADRKEIMKNVPWDTLVLICGVGILIDVAIKAGTIKMIGGWFGSEIPSLLVPVALAVLGGVMSFFSSTLGVVAPAMFPVIPLISEASGLNPAYLLVALIIGAQSTSLAPFSAGGSLILGSSTIKEEDKDQMYKDLMFKATPLSLACATITTIILMFIL